MGSNTRNLEVARAALTSLISGDNVQAISLVNESFEMSLPAAVRAKPICGIEAFGKYVEVATRVFEGAAKIEELNSVSVGDTVVLEVKIIAQTKSGKSYENLYVHWFELEAGKVSRWREHVDTKYAFDALS